MPKVMQVDEERLKKFKSELDSTIKNTEQELARHFNRLEDFDKIYEGRNSLGVKPFDEWIESHTGIASTSCDVLQARLFGTIWNPQTLEFMPTNKYFKDNAKFVTRFMKAVAAKMGLGSRISKILEKVVRHGYYFAKPYFAKKRRKVQRVIERRGLFTNEKRYKVDEIEYKEPRLDVIDNDLVLVPESATSLDLDQSRVIMRKVYPTYDQLLEMQQRDEIEGVDDKLVADYDAYYRSHHAEKVRRVQKIDHTRSFSKMTTPMELIEGFIRTNQLEEDDGFRDYYFLYAKHGGKFLYLDELVKVNRLGEHLMTNGVFKPLGDSLRGTGLIEDIEELQYEMDITHSQRINAQMVVIAPFFFYRPASGFKPEKIRISPGYGIPAQDPQRDVYFPQLAVTNFYTSMQDETFIMSLIERKTMVSSYQLGQESNVLKSRATASGTLAIIGQGMQNFNILARRIADSIEQTIMSILKMYQSDPKAFKDAMEHILSFEGSETLDIPESVEDILGEFRVRVNLDPSTGNTFMNREIKIAVYQMLVQDPFVNQDPARAWSLRKMVADAFELDDIEDFIGPKPPSVTESQQTAKEEFYMMMQGKYVEVPENEDHMTHLVEHAQMLYSEAFSEMSPEYRGLFLDHIERTQMALMKKMQMQAVEAQLRANQGLTMGEGNEGQGDERVLSGRPMGTSEGEGARSVPRPGVQISPGGAGGAPGQGGGGRQS